jgi:hypothetical protein
MTPAAATAGSKEQLQLRSSTARGLSNGSGSCIAPSPAAAASSKPTWVKAKRDVYLTMNLNHAYAVMAHNMGLPLCLGDVCGLSICVCCIVLTYLSEKRTRAAQLKSKKRRGVRCPSE